MIKYDHADYKSDLVILLLKDTAKLTDQYKTDINNKCCDENTSTEFTYEKNNSSGICGVENDMKDSEFLTIELLKRLMHKSSRNFQNYKQGKQIKPNVKKTVKADSLVYQYI